MEKCVLSELDLLKIKCASYEVELVTTRAQESVKKVNDARDELIRSTFKNYIGDEPVENYQINLDTGEISERQANA